MLNRCVSRRKAVGRIVLLAGAVASVAGSVSAQVWNNPAGGSWNTAANWNPASVPTSSTARALTFEASGATSYTATNNIGTGTYSLNSLTVNNTGTGTITLAGAAAGNTLTFGGTNPSINVSAGTVILTGLMAGSATITKTGAGTFVHDSNNTAFTGTLIVNAGTFVNRSTLVATANFNPVSIVVNNGGTYQFGENTAGDPNLPNTTYITVNTGGTVNWQEGETYGGINLQGGTINLQQGGMTTAGTTNQSWTSGTLTASATNSIGGTVPIDKTTSGTVTISGSASIAGSGAAILNIAEGTVVHAAATNLGTIPISLGAASTAGVFEYRGATASRAGLFTVNAGGGTINVTNSAAVLTLSGGTTGTGMLTKSGPGGITLTGNALHSGGTTIGTGTLQIGSGGTAGSLTGNVVNNGTLAFNRSDDISFGGSISGTGGITKLGTSTTTLTGTLSYGGPTLISAGTLRMTPGTFAGGMTLGSGATLISTSPATGAVTLSVPTLALDAAGSTIKFELNQPTNPTIPLLSVTGTDGLTLNGGTHTLALTNSQPVLPGTITLISYAGAPITGGFNVTLPARTAANLDYSSGNKIDLVVTSVDSIKWNGTADGNWDMGTDVNVGGTQNFRLASNASATNFIPNDVVAFDDTAGGVGGTNVSLVGSLTPTLVTVDNTTKTYTFGGSGSIDGPASLIKKGAGSLTLLTNNGYTGTTTVTAGTLSVGNGGSTGTVGTGSVSIAAGATLVINRAEDQSIAAAVGNNGTLTKSGTNNLTITGPLTGAGSVGLPAGGSLILNTPADYAYDGAITGVGSLTKQGAGTVTLTGASTYTGGTIISAGTLQIGNGGPTGGIVGDVSINGVSGANGTLLINRSGNLTLGSINGPGGNGSSGKIIMNGTGNVTITGTIKQLATTPGSITASAGTITLTNPDKTGIVSALTATGAGTIALDTTNAPGGVETIATPILAGTGTFAKVGPGTLLLTGAHTLTGTLRIDSGTVIQSDPNGDSSGGSMNPASIVVNNTGKYEFGKGGITGENPDLPATTYVTINTGGEVVWRIGESLGGVHMNGGTLTLNGGNVGSDGIAAQAWTSGTINGVTANSVGGALALNKTTSGVVTVSGLASVTSPMNIQDGTIRFATAANLGTTAVTLGSATTAGTFEYQGVTASRAGAFALNAGGGAINVTDAAATLTLTGTFTGTGKLTKGGAGTAVIATPSAGISLDVAAGALKVNPYAAGPVSITAGGTLAINSGAGTTAMSTPTLALGGTTSTVRFDLNSGTPSTSPLLNVANTDGITSTGTLFLNNAQVLTNGTYKLIGYSGTPITAGFGVKFSGRTTGNLDYSTAGQINAVVTGVDVIRWRGTVDANWDTGTDIDIGGTNNWIKTSDSTATNFITGDAASFDDTATRYAVTIPGTVQPSTVTVNNSAANPYTFSGAGAIAGAGTIAKSGAGTLTVSTTNTFTGAWQLDGGVLNVAAAGNLGATAASVQFNGGTLRITANYSPGTGAQAWTFNAGGGTVDVPAGVQVVRTGNSLFGTGQLTKTGDGVIAVGTNASTFSGPVVIQGGKILFNSNQWTSVSGFTVQPGGTYEINDDQNGDSFGFATNAVVHLSGSGTGGIGAFLSTSQGGTTGPKSLFTNPIVLDADTTFVQTNGSTAGVTGLSLVNLTKPVSGPGALIKSGNGSMILSAVNTYTGATTITAGTMYVGDGVNGAITSTAAVTVQTGATLGGKGSIAGPVTVQANATVSPGGDNNLVANSSVGVLSIAGLALNATSTTGIEINGPGNAGTTFDQLHVTSGTLALAGNLVITAGTGSNDGLYSIILSDPTVTLGSGKFSQINGIPVDANDQVVSGGSTFTLMYGANLDGGAVGNDVLLAVNMPVPEPTSLLLPLAGLLMLRRRRREGGK